jgi:hypothetical protein
MYDRGTPQFRYWAAAEAVRRAARRPSILPTHEVITDPGSNALRLVRRRFARYQDLEKVPVAVSSF